MRLLDQQQAHLVRKLIVVRSHSGFSDGRVHPSADHVLGQVRPQQPRQHKGSLGAAVEARSGGEAARDIVQAILVEAQLHGDDGDTVSRSETDGLDQVEFRDNLWTGGAEGDDARTLAQHMIAGLTAG